MAAEARHVVTHAAPAGETAVLDVERGVDADGLAAVGDKESEQPVAECGIVLGAVGPALALAALAACALMASAQDAAAGAAALGLVGSRGHHIGAVASFVATICGLVH